uniref:Uncharacterized protein n=1 Tax=Anguilla anguilla TaxID=7936 RepID=A0A0E9UPU4_ANGAN
MLGFLSQGQFSKLGATETQKGEPLSPHSPSETPRAACYSGHLIHS